MDPSPKTIVFRERLKPCAGDLRIVWRMSLILILLDNSRSKKASMAKLHVLNDAIRTESSLKKIRDMMDRTRSMLEWRLRVEPALSRAIDFLIGEKLAIWQASGGRMYLKLLPSGEVAAKIISRKTQLEGMNVEAAKLLAKGCSEAFINALIGYGKQKI